MRHVEGLTEALFEAGHEVRVLAPVDPPDLGSRILHRGAEPQRRDIPDWLVPMGRSFGVPANGAMSNLQITPSGIAKARRELRTGNFDVLHIQEPVAPILGWDSCTTPGVARVGTFHAYAESSFSNGVARALGGTLRLNGLHQRIAVSQAARWTASHFYGGRYRVIPNGTDVPDLRPAKSGGGDGRLRILFIGQAVSRKGLPVLLRAFEALRDHLDVELTLVGIDRDTLEPLMNDLSGTRPLGKVDDARKLEELVRADVLCAPSLGGESFGMVLTEAFAAGTPVVASDISGYRDVVRHGIDGILVPPGDPTALALVLRDLGDQPDHVARLGARAWERAGRFSWQRIATEVEEVYAEALAAPEPVGLRQRIGVKVGTIPADLRPRVPADPSPPPDDTPQRRRERRGRHLRQGLAALAGVAAVVAAGFAVDRIGPQRVASALIGSKPSLVLLGLGVMCASMALRAVSWQAMLRAALPKAGLGFVPVMRATCIGVLMSATLPARLGEPARAMVIARRAGDPRETLPPVLGTLVSQTLINLVALVGLGAVMIGSVPLFNGRANALLAVSLVPLAMLVLVLLAPTLFARGPSPRWARLEAIRVRTHELMLAARRGLRVFRQPRPAGVAITAQFGAWVLQWLSCFVLLEAMGLGDSGLGAAAAVLFAVNVTAAIPATPANIGVFQAACVAVLAGGFGVSTADALGYGIVLQAVELATAVMMGMPSLLGEGITWREVRLRTLHTAPISLPARGESKTAEIDA